MYMYLLLINICIFIVNTMYLDIIKTKTKTKQNKKQITKQNNNKKIQK